jgi:hypothetical protein
MTISYRLVIPGVDVRSGKTTAWRLFKYNGKWPKGGGPVKNWPAAAERDRSFEQRSDLDARLTDLGLSPDEQAELHLKWNLSR